MEVLMGSQNGFLSKRLKNYSVDRNNPCKSTALSGLSPYLHFGQISAQRCALEARKMRTSYPQVCFSCASVYSKFILSVSKFPSQNGNNILHLMFSITLLLLTAGLKGNRCFLGGVDCAEGTC